MNPKYAFVTAKQLEFAAATQPIRVMVGGRGFGKTSIAGSSNYENVFTMPRSKGILVGSTFGHLWDNEIPPRKHYWKKMLGLVEVTGKQKMGHFIIGKKPPSYFETPLMHPENWEHTITFVNGSCIELKSMARHEAGRGGNADWGELCEASTINKDRFIKEIFPTVRGMAAKYPLLDHNNKPLKDKTTGKNRPNPRYLSWVYVSNMPWTYQGQWILDMQARAIEEPDLVFYLEGNIYDALEIYGAEYIEKTKKEVCAVNPIVWQVEYMNQRLTKHPNAFYQAYNAERHGYKNNEYGHDPYYQADKALEISLDFNKNFNSLTIWQQNGSTLACLRDLFIKGNKSIDELVKLFVDTHWEHLEKVVYVYGDANGNTVEFSEKISLFKRICSQLQAHGWLPIHVTRIKTNPDHILKQQNLNQLLEERHEHLPKVRFNETQAHYTIRSLKSATLTDKFKKDKASEKDPTINQENATHLSDTVDYYLMPKTAPLFARQGTPITATVDFL